MKVLRGQQEPDQPRSGNVYAVDNCLFLLVRCYITEHNDWYLIDIGRTGNYGGWSGGCHERKIFNWEEVFSKTAKRVIKYDTLAEVPSELFGVTAVHS